MAAYDVGRICPGHHFSVSGVSYIGAPVPGTAVYVTRKISDKIKALQDAENCLVFAETGIDVPEQAGKTHAVVFTDNPQLAYARLAVQLEQMQRREDSAYRYHFHKDGYYASENAVIGDGAYIEPGCMIGHRVTIGRNAVLLKGTVIRNAQIGDDFISNEYAVIGANAFTMAEDGNGGKIRIPSLGGVRIGSSVEAGAHDNISRGSAGDTVLEDHVRLDALVHIGHDARLGRNVEVTAGVIVAGFAEIREGAFLGINSSIRNRVSIGAGTVVGMGAVAAGDAGDGLTVLGNPARPLRKA